MYFRFLFGLAVLLCLSVGARAQTANQVITGYLSTSGCPSAATTPCFIQYGPGGASTVTIGAPLGSQTAANSVAVVCNSGCSGGPTDESAFTFGTTGIFTGGVYQTTATSNPLVSGTAGSVQMTSTRSFFVNLRNSAGAESGVAAVPLQVSLANTAANGTAVLVTGTGGTFPLSGATSNATSAVATSSTNAPTVGYGYGFNGTTWDQLQVDASKFLKVNCAVGCAGGSTSNASSGVATSSTNGATVSYDYGFNGTTWDQLQVDGSKFLKVTVAAALPAGTNLLGKTGIDQTTPGTTNGAAIVGVNAATALAGAGATGTGSLRVTAAQDTTTIAGSAPGTAGSASANAITVQGIASMTPVQVSQATAANLNATVVQSTGSNLHIVCDSGCSSSTAPADESAFTAGTTSQSPVGGFFQTTATSNALTTGQMGAFQVTANRALFANLRNAAGTEIGTTANPVGGNVAQVNGVTTLTGTGAVGTGAQRIAVGTDTATIAGSAPGTAGSASANVVTVQGVASMTKLLVTPDSVALPANQSVNVSQVNGVTTLTGSGATGTGSQRVTVAGDTATVSGIAPGTVAAGAAPANTILAGCQYNATIPAATDTQALAVQCDPSGRARVTTQPTTYNAVSGTATQTGTTSTSLIGAVTSNRIYATAFACYNSGSSASVISFQDGSGGTTLYQTIVPAGGGSNLGGGTALFKTTAGNALYFAPGTASTTVGCSASGFSAL